MSGATTSDNKEKVKLENIRQPRHEELEVVGKTFELYYKWRGQRDGTIDQFQGRSLEQFLATSRELFWNSTVTPSNDLSALDLSLSIGFIRKEVWDFASRLVSQDFKGRMNGENLDTYGVKVLQAMYDKWRFKSNDKVEKFWQILYGAVNGTVVEFVGYNDAKVTHRYLREYDKEKGGYRIEEKDDYYWNDVWTEIAPLEDIYFSKLWERDSQRQGRLLWRTQVDWKDFQRDFHQYENAEYVYPGNQISDDSLYFRLLSGSGVTTTDKVEILKLYDVVQDRFTIIANGVWLNPLKGKMGIAPMPFNHKLMPFGVTQWKGIDEKFVYGMSMPFELKDYQKILNTSMTMLVEQELRDIDPPIISSDFEAPQLIFGQHKVIPVNDVEAYKVMETKPASSSFFNMVNSLQSLMSAQANGGTQSISPSKQPKSAREAMQIAQLKQEALGNSLLMYYNMLRQEMTLMLKTAVQFYPVNKYAKINNRVLRAIKIPDTSLTNGGVGNLHVRFVNKKQDDIITYFESVEKSITEGRQNEIIECPIDVLQDLDFIIHDIEIKPGTTSDIEKAAWMEQVFNPMMQYFVPMGIADPAKIYLQLLEKYGEHPADYTSDKVLPQLMSSWGQEMNFKMPVPGEGGDPTKQGAAGPQTGNLNQSVTGTRFGQQGGAPIPQGAGQ